MDGYRGGTRGGDTVRAGVVRLSRGGRGREERGRGEERAAFLLASHPFASSPCPLALVSYRKSLCRGEKRKGKETAGHVETSQHQIQSHMRVPQ